MKFLNVKMLLVALSVFVVLNCIFFYPNLQGKEIHPSDSENTLMVSKKCDDYFKAHDKKGDVYWAPNLFGGTPTALMYGGENPNTLGNLQATILKIFPEQMMMILISMLCFFAFARSMKWNYIISIIGSVAFAFSSYNIILAMVGHGSKLMCVSYSMGCLAGMNYIFNGKKWLGALLFALFCALNITTGHYQILYYFIFIGFTFMLYQFLQAVKNKTINVFLTNSLIILGLGILSLLPALKMLMVAKSSTKYTIREMPQLDTSGIKKVTPAKSGLDKDYAFQWSNGILESLSILLPRIEGGSSGEKYSNGKTKDYLTSVGANEDAVDNITSQLPLYYGPQPFLMGSVYFGAIIIFLFVLGLFIIPNKLKWWFTGLSLLAFMMSWGKYFPVLNDFLFSYLPGYNKFRTPSMILVIPQMLMCLVAIWALSELFIQQNKELIWKNVKKALYITGGITVVFGLLGSMFLNYHNPQDAELLKQYAQMFGGDASKAQSMLDAILDDRASANRMDGLRSLLYILASVGVIWAYLQNKIKANIGLIALGLLITIDLMSFDFRYINEKSYSEKREGEYTVQPRAVDTQILQDKDPYYRVIDLSKNPYTDAYCSYFHNSLGGYHPVKLRIYQDLIENQLQKNNREVINMLNTKYIIAPSQKQGAEQVFPNPTACGNAWFVNKINFVPTPLAEMRALDAPSLGDTTNAINGFKPLQNAIVQESFKPNITATEFTKTADATIKLTKFDMQQLSFESNNTNAGFGVFSDVYYPECWHAYIDGKEVPIIKTDYVLRGLEIPAGKHSIDFKTSSVAAVNGQKISSIGNIVLLFFLLLAIGMSIKTKELEA